LTTFLPVSIPGVTVINGWVVWLDWQLICLLTHTYFLSESTIHHSLPLSTHHQKRVVRTWLDSTNLT
jgi:hypothetical protein